VRPVAEQTAISWCDATFNPWWGCQHVSDACTFCYAEALSKRTGFVEWGPGTERRRTGAVNWGKPLAWNRKAALDGVRRRVFCASMADFFDNQVPADWRRDAWALIRACDSLEWLILTKRPQMITRMLPEDWGDGWPHVRLGTTVENQEEAERRIPPLLVVPSRLGRFLSVEPMLGPVDLDGIWGYPGSATCEQIDRWPIGWVICGGESGPHARPTDPAWVRALHRQCLNASVPFHLKQWGEFLMAEEVVTNPVRPPGDEEETAYRYQDGYAEIGWSDHFDIMYGAAADDRGAPERIWHEYWSSGTGRMLRRVGVKRAGALLDGVSYREFPRA